MTKRGDAPTRRDRPTQPFSKLPDAVYSQILPYLTPYEFTLLIALKCQAWRKDGSKKGVIRKSLRRISKDIRMAWSTTWRAFEGLHEKGFVRADRYGIRLLDPDFTRPITTAITTTVQKGGQRIKSESGPTRARGGPTRARKWPHQGQEGHLVPFPVNALDHGRDDLKETARDPAGSRATEIVKNSPASVPTVTAPPSVQDYGGRSARKAHRKESQVQEPKDSSEIATRDLPRDEAAALLMRIKADALRAAAAGEKTLWEKKNEAREREEESRKKLLEQRDALLESEGGGDGV